MSGRCLEVVWKLFRRCLEADQKVSRRCLEGVLKGSWKYANVIMRVCQYAGIKILNYANM